MAGINAFGTKLERSEDGTTFAPIADITSLTPPGISRDTIDVTSHDSTEGWMEFVGSLKDPGEVKADINYQPTDHDSLVEDFEDTVPRKYRITFPDGTTWAFGAILTGFEPDAPYDDKLAASLTWKVTGKPTITAGA